MRSHLTGLCAQVHPEVFDRNPPEIGEISLNLLSNLQIQINIYIIQALMS